MENIEFISAKDLPLSDAESVDVLCVDNGELKLKAGASLGGGSDKWDAEFVCTTWDNPETYSFKSGSYQTLMEKALSGEVPKIRVSLFNTEENEAKWHSELLVLSIDYAETENNDFWFYVYYAGEAYWFAVSPDNTIWCD